MDLILLIVELLLRGEESANKTNNERKGKERQDEEICHLSIKGSNAPRKTF